MHSILTRLNKVSLAWDDRDASWAERVVALARRWMRDAYEEFIRRRSFQPVTIWYGADGTEHGFRTKEIVSLGGRKAIRRLHHREDLFVQRVLVFDSMGNRSALVPQPVVLADKTVWSHFEAWRCLEEHPFCRGIERLYCSISFTTALLLTVVLYDCEYRSISCIFAP